MISVVIPVLNDESVLPATLTALVPAAVEGIVREVIVVDGGSKDASAEIADRAGADVITSPTGRGAQLRAGAKAARHPWLLFLNADTVLDAGWEREADQFMERVDSGRGKYQAAAFRFALDDDGAAPRALESLVTMRCALLGLPFGDQGLLTPRATYEAAGGHRPLPVMDDLDLARRIGSRRIKLMRSRAVNNAARYRADGYMRRALGNEVQRILYSLRLAPLRTADLHGEQ
jgi:rSAM/selenodomain-associated transferase 2